jgi:hypothetical protein
LDWGKKDPSRIVVKTAHLKKTVFLSLKMDRDNDQRRSLQKKTTFADIRLKCEIEDERLKLKLKLKLKLIMNFIRITTFNAYDHSYINKKLAYKTFDHFEKLFRIYKGSVVQLYFFALLNPKMIDFGESHLSLG